MPAIKSRLINQTIQPDLSLIMNIAKSIRLFALTAALAVTFSTARAQSIGVSFGDGAAQDTLATTDLAGAPGFAQTNFTNFVAVSGTALKNNAGVATTAAFSLSNNNGGSSLSSFQSAVAGADERLMNGLYSGGSGTTLSLTNIPYASYSIVLYSLSSNRGVTQFTLGATSFFGQSPNRVAAGYLDNTPATAFTYTRATSTDIDNPTLNADYVVFTGLSGASQSVSFQGISMFASDDLQAFQIVNTAVVPEPSTWAMLLGGAGVLAFVQIRRRRAALIP